MKEDAQMGSYVGQRMPRYDSLGHVTGKTQFVDDITLPGMLTIKVRRSPVARAKILNIDTTEAKKCPGVYAVATAKDVPLVPERRPERRQRLL